MNIGGAIVGGLCLIAIIVFIGYVAGVNAQQAPVSDTYGNQLTASGNTSIGLVGNVSTVGVASAGPLVIIVGVILIILVICGFYVASKATGNGR